MKAKILRLLAVGLLMGPVATEAAIIETTFAGGNSLAGNMFDVTVEGNDLLVTGMDVHLGINGSAGGSRGQDSMLKSQSTPASVAMPASRPILWRGPCSARVL